jgi:hypothetical protein
MKSEELASTSSKTLPLGKANKNRPTIPKSNIKIVERVKTLHTYFIIIHIQ